MAGAVEAALLRIIAANLAEKARASLGEEGARGGGDTPAPEGAEVAAARDYLAGLSATGRYQRDVWY
jgi:hypothetical protein